MVAAETLAIMAAVPNWHPTGRYPHKRDTPPHPTIQCNLGLSVCWKLPTASRYGLRTQKLFIFKPTPDIPTIQPFYYIMATASAAYSSPKSVPFALTEAIPAAEDKTLHLASLRKAVISLQIQINRELTARMDEDKARESGTNAAPAVDEAKEEENYGEEVQEEED